MKFSTFRGWQISKLGLGCYALSGAYGTVDGRAFERVIQAAYDQGVNYFDTAEGYGQAEAFLGKAVAPFRSQILIATKLSGQDGAPDLSRDAVIRACESSLRRLQTDIIDLYQIHFDDPQTPVEETTDALDALIEMGKIRAYGVCHLSESRVRQYAEVGHPFSVLMELSLVALTSRQTLLPICREYDLAALAFSVTGRGILSGRYHAGQVFEEGDIRNMDPLFKRERFESALRTAAFLSDIAADYDTSAVVMAIAWVLAQPQVVCALTGTSSLKHLSENLSASEMDLAPADLAAVEGYLKDEQTALAELQRESVVQILNDPLPGDAEQAFNDLLYVLETAIIIGLVQEEEAVPAFRELLGLREADPSTKAAGLVRIQDQLRMLMV